MKMVPQQYCLRWKHHHSNVQSMFAQLLEKGRFCDVTLYCSPNFATQVPNKDTVDPQNIRGVSLRAHRVVLAACSELLGSLLGAHEAQGEPVLVIDGAEPRHLKALLDYMYTGEMNVHRSQLASLLKTAEELRIKGLTDIRWNNKDEPPDSNSGVITTTTSPPHLKTSSSSPDIKHESSKSPVELNPEPKFELKNSSERTERTPIERMERISAGERMSEVINEALKAELRAHLSKREEINDNDSRTSFDKFSVNGGPPPLIKLPQKDKSSPPKREHYDSDTPSPKRVRRGSATENTDEDSRSTGKPERDDWHHGNLDITAERVVGWGMSVDSAEEVGSADEDDWADAPTDIGSFLHTRLEVAGDNSNDDESNESGCGSKLAAALSPGDIKIDLANVPLLNSALSKTALGSKSGPTDPRFTDVIKLNDYLKHGRRPQFWEESYVKRVMEAVRLKELEMKQAAEILGVSYGTLYGRYRDVYGCINRPYRTARDVWQAKGPSEVLDRLQRGDITLEAASSVLGVTPTNLAAYIADAPVQEKELFEPIPIEIDPSLKMKPRLIPKKQLKPQIPPSTDTKANRRPGSSGAEGEEGNSESVNNPGTASGKWPSIRVAALDSLLDTTASASALMRSRPDLTIVAAKRTDSAAE